MIIANDIRIGSLRCRVYFSSIVVTVARSTVLTQVVHSWVKNVPSLDSFFLKHVLRSLKTTTDGLYVSHRKKIRRRKNTHHPSPFSLPSLVRLFRRIVFERQILSGTWLDPTTRAIEKRKSPVIEPIVSQCNKCKTDK